MTARRKTMLRKLLRVALLTIGSVVAFATLNCATVMQGTDQGVAITSSPDRASVEIRQDNNLGQVVFTGVTPVECKLARSNEYNVGISLPGYETKNVHIFRKLSAAIAGNAFAGGCCGGGVDMASGAAYDLDPNSIDVTLTKSP